jgi:hypothetical protein
MKTKGRFFLKSVFLFIIFFFLMVVSSTASFAFKDLVITDFDTCWETYDDNGTTRWRAYTWVKVKNQGNEPSSNVWVKVRYYENQKDAETYSLEALASSYPLVNSRINVQFPRQSPINIPVLNPGDSVTGGVYLYGGDGNLGRVCPTCGWPYYMNDGPPAAAFCNGNGVYLQEYRVYGWEQIIIPYSYYCGGSTAAALYVEGSDDKRDNNLSIRTWSPSPGYLVKGYSGRSCSATPTPTPAKVYLNFEAEAGTKTSPMTAVYDKNVSGCYYLHSPQGSGSGKGYVSLNVDIPQIGYYVVFGRVNGVDWSSDSFYLSWDNGTEINWSIPHGWQWNRANNNGTPKNWNLTKGTHTLKIRTREDGSQIDALVVTNNYNHQPTYFKVCN